MRKVSFKSLLKFYKVNKFYSKYTFRKEKCAIMSSVRLSGVAKFCLTLSPLSLKINKNFT